MKHVKLFESFLNTEWINEATKMTLGTEISSSMIKPDVLQKINAALGLKDGDSISPDKIKGAQKKNKMKETGKLDVMTVLALLKGSAPAKEPEKIQTSGKELEIESSPVGVSTANESYYLNEADEQPKGINVVKIVNSAEKKIVSVVNSEIQKMIKEYSPWNKTYTVDLLLGSVDFTTNYKFDIKITSIKATSASFKPVKDQNLKGWYLAKVAGTVKGTVSGTYKPPGLGDISSSMDINVGFSMNAWVNKFTSPEGTIQIFPPQVSVSTNSLDVIVGYLSVNNNAITFTNSLFGKFQYPLPLQSYVDKCFDPKGGPLVSKIKDLEKNFNV